MDTRLVVDVRHGADELGEDLLHFGRLNGALVEEVVVELIAWAILEHQPDQRFGDYDLVQPCDVRVEELAMVVDLAGEVGVVLLRRLEHDLGAIGEFMGCQVDFAKAALAYEPSERVVADRLEVVRRELIEELLVRVCELLPLGLQFSLSPEIRLHGLRPRNVPRVVWRCVMNEELLIGAAVG